MLEKIRSAIKAEQDKVMYLSSSDNPRLDIEMILMRVYYLSRMEAEELRKLNRDY